MNIRRCHGLAWWDNFRMPSLIRPILVGPFLFVILAAPAIVFGRWERSGWILMTTPYDRAFALNPLLGWTTLLSGRPFHIENETTLFQDAMFRGAKLFSLGFYDKYFFRPVFAFLTSFGTDAFGFIYSAVAVNCACWAIASYISFR